MPYKMPRSRILFRVHSISSSFGWRTPRNFMRRAGRYPGFTSLQGSHKGVGRDANRTNHRVRNGRVCFPRRRLGALTNFLASSVVACTHRLSP